MKQPISTKMTGLKLIASAILLFLILPASAYGVTIADPLTGTEEYSIAGSGTAVDPYVIGVSEANNRITAVGLDLMSGQAPEAIWQVEHWDEGKIDYMLRFSSSIAQVVNAPLMLDINSWQEKEGLLNLEIGEKDSLYMPATLILDVSGYQGFEDGAAVTVSGKTNLRTRVDKGFVEFAIDNGGDHVLTAEGYEQAVEEDDSPDSGLSFPSITAWDEPDEAGDAVAQEYTCSGTSELPFIVDLSASYSSIVEGAAFNNLKDKSESRTFMWKNEDGTVKWAYLAEGVRMSLVDDADEFDMSVDVIREKDAVTVCFLNEGKFPGRMRVTLNVGTFFPDAAIVAVNGEQLSTCEVVDRGYITFWVDQGGGYIITDTGENVGSASVSDGKTVSADSGDNIYTMCKYKGEGCGTIDEPLTLLGKLDDTFHASWKSMNTIAGYAAAFNPSESSYDGTKVMKVMVEYRSPVTGKLIASLSMDGSKWRMTPESMKGPYYMDYKLNPGPAVIQAALESHSLYTGRYASRKAPALKTLIELSERDDIVLFFMSRTRAFAGAVRYKLDVSPYFEPGDVVGLKYILGSCNGDLYHGEAPNNAQLLLEEASYSRYDTETVVDALGYISFPLYTGGFFTVSKTGMTSEKEDNWYSAQRDAEKQDIPGQEDKGAEQAEGEDSTVERLIEEPVGGDTHTETGTLVHTKDSDNFDEINYTDESGKGKIRVSGYLLDTGVSLKSSFEGTGNMDKELNHSEVGSIIESAEIMLQKQNGFNYQMNGDEYLDVTICLGTDFSIFDENLLFVKHVDKIGYTTNEVFSSHSELGPDNNMYLTFRTSHTGTFAFLRTKDEKQLTAAVALKQEYTSEATTALAEQSIIKKDEKKTIKFILIITLTVFLTGVIVTDIRRRQGKRAVEM